MSLQVTNVRPRDVGVSEARLWTAFQQRSQQMQSPFLSLTFAQAVGRARPNSRVAVVEVDGRIEAFLPYELHPNRIGMPLGWPLNDLQGFVSSEIPIAARAVVRMAGLRGWRFDHAPVIQTALAPHQYEGTVVQCSMVDLSDGYEAYYRTRSSSLRRETARKQRRLEREVGPITFEWNDRSPESLRLLFDWKSQKYVGAQKLFVDTSALQIIEDLAATDNADCAGALNVLSAGGKPIAADLWLRGPQGIAAWNTAYEATYGGYSPGTILFFLAAEEVAKRGLGKIDLGYGQHAYKFRFSNASYPIMGGAVWASRSERFARSAYRHIVSRTRRREPVSAGERGKPPAPQP